MHRVTLTSMSQAVVQLVDALPTKVDTLLTNNSSQGANKLVNASWRSHAHCVSDADPTDADLIDSLV